MLAYEDLTFQTIEEDDIDSLTQIMKRAFDEDSRIHLGLPTGGPDGYDNGDFLRKYALNPRSTAYRISKDGTSIGGIILWINPITHVNFLGTIFIDPAYENMGLGKKVWDFVEAQYPDTKVWGTETPIFSHRNHHFYINKCGFHVIKITNPKSIDNGDGQFILQKVMMV